ncbi:hypothetical protein FLK61_27595 [Paenalkalicoccus suaedae]|uniref:GerMN domain-containing protein n=1 Tax=Paenalkalicoccus suaedae TaxID=2592382 RepID=A0A859FCF4_9BACI|nr:hypothetical protein [Paenalkalicoccus suaedae]QKS70518.1 hypothetical protein FLK61_27595 [Paenalkalicoccus suaedae]
MKKPLLIVPILLSACGTATADQTTEEIEGMISSVTEDEILLTAIGQGEAHARQLSIQDHEWSVGTHVTAIVTDGELTEISQMEEFMDGAISSVQDILTAATQDITETYYVDDLELTEGVWHVSLKGVYEPTEQPVLIMDELPEPLSQEEVEREKEVRRVEALSIADAHIQTVASLYPDNSSFYGYISDEEQELISLTSGIHESMPMLLKLIGPQATGQFKDLGDLRFNPEHRTVEIYVKEEDPLTSELKEYVMDNHPLPERIVYKDIEKSLGELKELAISIEDISIPSDSWYTNISTVDQYISIEVTDYSKDVEKAILQQIPPESHPFIKVKEIEVDFTDEHIEEVIEE